MKDVTIFIKKDKPSVVVNEHGGGILNDEQDKLIKQAFGDEPRRIDMSYEELFSAIKKFEDNQ